MNNCIFCRIADKTIPCYLIYENDNIMAFLDLSQSTKGHTLIIPKTHYENVFNLDEDTAASLFKPVPKIASAIKKAFNASGLNIVNNNGKVAGQSVFHFHIHLIPRYEENEGFKFTYQNNSHMYTEAAFHELAKKIRAELIE